MMIGVVGGGMVGKATARCWLEHCEEVRVTDIDPKRSTHSLEQVLQCDFIFVCLPTPSKTTGECDTSFIDKFFTHIDLAPDRIKGTVVLRSTVPIGTTRRLAEQTSLPILHSPEFFTARCSLVDSQIPARMIIGMPVTIFRCSNLGKLIHIYRERFPATEVMLMTSDESEAVKLIQNSFFAVKVAFWNEARSLADVLKLRWDVVMNGILSDGRISPSHTRVPGPDGKRGFGGECLPKDLASLSSLLDDYLEVPNGSIVCKAALRRNEIDRMSK